MHGRTAKSRETLAAKRRKRGVNEDMTLDILLPAALNVMN